MQIRPINSSDSKVWSELRTALWSDTEDGHGAEIADFFAGVSHDVMAVYVVESGGSVVGFIELNIRNFAEGSRESQVPYVEGWYVHPQHQKQGLGKALMMQAEAWAKAQGFGELASDTEHDNMASQTIHRNLGFQEVERVVCFLKKL